MGQKCLLRFMHQDIMLWIQERYPCLAPAPGGLAASALLHPFTHTTCLSVCSTSTKSAWAAITASMSL